MSRELKKSKLGNFPYFSSDIFTGVSSGVALCSLWTPKARFVDLLNEIAVVGNLYSHYGLGILIRNVLAEGSIKHLLITGKDCPNRTKQQGENILSGNIDLKVTQLKREYVDTFYKRVRIHDLRRFETKNLKATEQYIEGLNSQPSNDQPILIPLPQPSFSVTEHQLNANIIEPNNLDCAHQKLLSQIVKSGHHIGPDSHGQMRLELIGPVIRLAPEFDWKITNTYVSDDVIAYGESILHPSNETEICEYGDLIYSHGLDQWKTALEVLSKKETSNKALITLWEPKSIIAVDPPCLAFIHIKIENGRVKFLVFLRSSECLNALPLDIAAIRYCQEFCANSLGKMIGELIVVIGSAHLYEYQYHDAEERIKELMPCIQRSEPNWRFWKNGQMFVAEQFTEDELLLRIEDRNILRVGDQVLQYLNDPKHILYIGMQIERLKANKGLLK
jgi:hypothetical protein